MIIFDFEFYKVSANFCFAIVRKIYCFFLDIFFNFLL